MIVGNDAGKKLEFLVKDNARKLQDLTAECQRFEIEMHEMEDKVRGENRVQETKLRSRAEARIAKARGDKDIATSQVRVDLSM